MQDRSDSPEMVPSGPAGAAAADPDAAPDPRTFSLDPKAGLYDRTARMGSRRRRSGSRSSGSHSGGSRESKAKRHLLITRVFAGLATLAAVLLAILLIQSRSQLGEVNAGRGAVASEFKRVQAELKEAKELIAAQQAELGALARQRLPGLAPIEFDKLYDINQRYLTKLSFAESGVGENKQITYYAVLKNSGAQAITPNATLLVFDRKGLQIGSARIRKEDATTPAATDALKPGETRTYSAPLETFRPGLPSYFLVEVG